MKQFILPAVAAIAFLITPAAPAEAGLSVNLGNGRIVVRDGNRDRNHDHNRDYRRNDRDRHHDRRDHGRGPRHHHHY